MNNDRNNNSCLKQNKLVFNNKINIQTEKNKIKDKFVENTQMKIIMNNIKSNKLSKGTKIMMENEKLHANEAIECGIYVTWTSNNPFVECFRIGSNSTCICGHNFPEHEKILNRKKFSSKCLNCKCKAFSYIPLHPEEIGEFWIPFQKNFDNTKWKVNCKCKHSWTDHSQEKFLTCKLCSCSSFNSNFCCVVCDKFWQDHEMSYELEHDRYMINKPIGENFIPFSAAIEIYNSIYKK